MAESRIKDLLNFIFKLSIDLHRRGRCGFLTGDSEFFVGV